MNLKMRVQGFGMFDCVYFWQILDRRVLPVKGSRKQDDPLTKASRVRSKAFSFFWESNLSLAFCGKISSPRNQEIKGLEIRLPSLPSREDG